MLQLQKGRIEVYYCENWSMRLDLTIVLLTALAVLSRRQRFPRDLQFLVDGFDAEVERFRQAHCQP